MQKLIAILFVLLLCSTTLLQGCHLPVNTVEQVADGDKGKEAKPEKKEGKEILAGCAKKMQTLPTAIPFCCNHTCNWPPQPVLSKPTPPPDVIC